MIAELRREGEPLPNLAALEAGGVRARLETLTPTLSPNIWTTIATGRLPEVHGIWSFQTRQVTAAPAGASAPLPAAAPAPRPMVTSADRKVRALWEMAGSRGIGSDVLGWWVTWPAEEVDGIMVSDRFLQEGLEARVHPGSFRQHLELHREVGRGENVPGWPILGDGAPAEARAYVDRFAASDWALATTAIRRLEARQGSLVLVYLRGLDPVCHRFWKYWRPEGYGVPPEEARALGVAVRGYYRFLDGILGALVAARGDRPVLVVSDHGMEGILGTPSLVDVRQIFERQIFWNEVPSASGDFLSSESTVTVNESAGEVLATVHVRRLDAPLFTVRKVGGAARVSVDRRVRPDDEICIDRVTPRSTPESACSSVVVPLRELTSPPPPEAHSGVHEAAPAGIFLLAGGGARRGVELAPLSVVDVAPTALALLGLPAAEDMPGKVPAEAFETRREGARIATYDATPRRVRAAPDAAAHDAELEEELRGLGYLGP